MTARFMTDPDDGVALSFTQMAAVPPGVVLGIFSRYGRPLAVTMPAAAPTTSATRWSGPTAPPRWSGSCGCSASAT